MTTTEPRERPFHYPTFWQEHEPLAACGTSHHLQAPCARGLGGDPLGEAMIMIFAIGPDHCQTWIGRQRQMLQDVGSGYRIVEGGTANKDDQQQPQDIDTDVAFAALDFLAAIIATLAPLFGRLYRLTIDTRSTWGWLLRGGLLFA